MHYILYIYMYLYICLQLPGNLFFFMSKITVYWMSVDGHRLGWWWKTRSWANYKSFASSNYYCGVFNYASHPPQLLSCTVHVHVTSMCHTVESVCVENTTECRMVHYWEWVKWSLHKQCHCACVQYVRYKQLFCLNFVWTWNGG